MLHRVLLRRAELEELKMMLDVLMQGAANEQNPFEHMCYWTLRKVYARIEDQLFLPTPLTAKGAPRLHAISLQPEAAIALHSWLRACNVAEPFATSGNTWVDHLSRYVDVLKNRSY
jgi:hypothetical protein